MTPLLFMIIMAAATLTLGQTQTTTDFKDGYNTGITFDKKSIVGNTCLDQTPQWCDGFLSGWIDNHISSGSNSSSHDHNHSTSTTTTTRCNSNATNCNGKSSIKPPQTLTNGNITGQ
jgi:hypothetical protein